MPRGLTDPPPRVTFGQLYKTISGWPGGQTPELETTGGVRFVAKASVTRDGRRFILLPHGNRIYEGDWGYMTNSMGKDGQRIGQYSVPLDAWATGL